MFQNIQTLSLEIASGSEEMTIGTQTILDEMTRLVDISQQIKASVEDISGRAEEIQAVVDNQASVTEATAGTIKDVSEQTRRFKLN